MARFCGSCGSPLNETSTFCGACGARAAQANVPAAASSAFPPPASPLPPVAPMPPVRQGTSPILKIVLIVAVLLLVLGTVSLFGMFYALHYASRKAHEFSRQVLSNSGIVPSITADSGSASGRDGGTIGPGACRLLSKEEVSRAIGVAIVTTKTTNDSCEYYAQGTSAEMAGKHVAAMMASHGANTQQQQMIQNLSRGLLGNAQGQVANGTMDAGGNTIVLAFMIDPNAARTQMTLNHNALDAIAPGGKPLEGIGDEAFDTAGSMMMVRKGEKLIRITYSTCPCTLDAIKPLAQTIAASL